METNGSNTPSSSEGHFCLDMPNIDNESSIGTNSLLSRQGALHFVRNTIKLLCPRLYTLLQKSCGLLKENGFGRIHGGAKINQIEAPLSDDEIIIVSGNDSSDQNLFPHGHQLFPHHCVVEFVNEREVAKPKGRSQDAPPMTGPEPAEYWEEYELDNRDKKKDKATQKCKKCV